MPYSPKFLRSVKFILPHEEEFARGHWGDENYVVIENVSGDSGGLTKYGIDQASHPHVDVRNLTRDGAIAIYFAEWQAHNLEVIPEPLAIAMFDVFVNGGGGHAVAWLQSAMNNVARLHPQLVVDGVMGPGTVSAAQYLNEDQLRAVIVFFIRQRDARFQAIARGHNAKFLNGWEQRDRDLEKFLGVR